MSEETPVEDPEVPEEPVADPEPTEPEEPHVEGDSVPVTFTHTVSAPAETWAAERERIERSAINGAISSALDAGFRVLRVTSIDVVPLRIEMHDGAILDGQVVVTAHVDGS